MYGQNATGHGTVPQVGEFSGFHVYHKKEAFNDEPISHGDGSRRDCTANDFRFRCWTHWTQPAARRPGPPWGRHSDTAATWPRDSSPAGNESTHRRDGSRDEGGHGH
jgi:hypothetical protein